MKNFKRFVCLMLCLTTLISMLAFTTACNGENEGDATEGNGETELQREEDTVYKQDLKSYSLVIPASLSANLKAIAENLAETLGTAWKFDMKVVADTAKASDFEILLGETNRPETATFKGTPFLEIEIRKTEAAKSISSHNGYKYKQYFVILSSFPSLLLLRARRSSLRKRQSPSVRAARTPSEDPQAYLPCLPS